MEKVYTVLCKFFCLSTALFFLSGADSSLSAQTTIPTGGIAFLELSADNPDRFSFIFLLDIQSGTQIRFTDAGWSDVLNALGTTENGLATWTATAAMSAGSVVEITINSGGTGGTASQGSITVAKFGAGGSGNFRLAASGDQVTAYQAATNAKPTSADYAPIAAISNASTGWGATISGGGNLDANTTDLPPGLTDGVNAVSHGSGSGNEDEFDNIMLDPAQCGFSGSAAAALLLINNESNWLGSNSIFATSFASSTGCSSFTINPAFPVEWLSINAMSTENGVSLTWETASEYNSHFFEVQWSLDGFMYESLDQLPAAGISSGVLQYEYLDQRTQTGTMYYRIRQVDIDGQFEFSPTIQVDVTASEVIRISPNPVSSILTLQAGSEIQDVTVMNI